ncbi:TlpA family protein disulfide reductase [Euzebya sp.]|uniref:TlpA family protein disulfide reductase n=1 Tax=Euzebya sp. TaxID=1971409 RepID=UPI0035168E17
MSTDMNPDEMSKRERQKARRQERLDREAQQQRKAGAQRTVFMVLAVLVGVALVGGIGYLLIQGSDASLGVEAATIEEGQTALPPATSAGADDAAVGMDAPDATGFTPEGDPITIGAEGQAQAIAFMAHWCPHCQEEAPLVADWVEEGLVADGVEIVAVSTFHDPSRPNWPPDEWLEREGWPGQVIVDSEDAIADAWGLQGTPMWTFVNAEGEVVARYAGRIEPEQFEQATALAAGEEPAPAEEG